MKEADSNDHTRQLALVLVTRSEEGGVWSTEAQRHTKALFMIRSESRRQPRRSTCETNKRVTSSLCHAQSRATQSDHRMKHTCADPTTTSAPHSPGGCSRVSANRSVATTTRPPASCTCDRK